MSYYLGMPTIRPVKKQNSQILSLRKHAEKIAGNLQPNVTQMTAQDVQGLIEELQTNQIELKLQNEQLQETQNALKEARDRYLRLYEFAPIGCLTIDKGGKILETNMMPAKMLGLAQKRLFQANLSAFVCPEFRNTWDSHRKALFARGVKQTSEIEMTRADGARLAVRLESALVGPKDERCCEIALIDITEKKAAEKALAALNDRLVQRTDEQASRIRFQAEAIAHLAEGVVITTGKDWLSSKVLFVNAAMRRISGYTADELIGRPRAILNGKQTDRTTVERIRRQLSKGRSCAAELVQYRKDGKTYEAELAIATIPSDGKFTTFVSIHRDVTARKKSEQALRASEQRFRQMGDHAPVLIWMSGVDKSCTWFNKPWLEFTGRTMEQELGSGWAEGVHKDDLKRCRQTYVTAFKARLPFTMVYRLRRHDGEWRWILDNGAPLQQEHGEFAGYIGSCVDITDRKQSEDALRDREEFLGAILNTVADAIITYNRRGVIISANPAAYRIFGYPAGELLGRNIKLLLRSAQSGDRSRSTAHFLTDGRMPIASAPHEAAGLRKDGSTFPMEVAISEISHMGLFTGIYRDISARKHTEQTLDQYRKDLQTMASELMLAEETERRRIAEDLHDGFGQTLFLLRTQIDRLPIHESQANEIGKILQEMGRMVSKMTFELSPPVLRKLGLRHAVRSLAMDMRQRYGLLVDLVDDDHTISLDERVALVLFRSIRELLINVVKHSETNRATLSLRNRNNDLYIEIKDQGKGFDPVEQSRHIGSGRFGLFSIRERMDYIGGMLKIQSAPGKGARITMRAPLEEAKAAAASAKL